MAYGSTKGIFVSNVGLKRLITKPDAKRHQIRVKKRSN